MVEGRNLDVVVVGSFMQDLVVRAVRRPRTGETVRGEQFDEFLGGKGVNQAVAAARAGARTAMVGRLGNDRHGDEFTALLAVEGIDATHVGRDPVHGTGIGLPVVEADGGNSIIIVPRANDLVDRAIVEAAAPVIEAARVLLLQLELPLDGALAAARIARAAGVTTVLNPAPYADLPAELHRLVDVVVANEVEAEQLTGLPCTEDNLATIAARLCAEHARLGAVVTLGGRGAAVLDGAADASLTLLAAHPVDPVDTVGAGDAFCGVLAARLAVGDPLITAARHANAAGALATTRSGAVPAMPYAAAIAPLLAANGALPAPRTAASA